MADSWVASMIPNYLLFAYSCFACRAKLVQDVIWGRKQQKIAPVLPYANGARSSVSLRAGKSAVTR